MSLFTGIDAERLPIITQLVQVELPDGWKEYPNRLLTSELSTFLFTNAEGGHIASHSVETLSRVAHLRDIAIEVMGEIADRGGVKWRTLFRIGEEIPKLVGHDKCRFETAFSIIRFTNSNGEMAETVGWTGAQLDPEVVIPLDRIRRAIIPNHPLVKYVADRIWQIIDEKENCRRCPICQNPYILTRTDKQLCSERCRSTHRSRERRNRLKETVYIGENA